MSAPSGPPWTAGPTGRRWGRYTPNPGLRVSDAERHEVADRLSKHYADGRLDRAEFDQRLDRAMNAKTRADLSGLLADLPSSEPPLPAPRPRWHTPRFLFLVAVVLVAAAIAHAMMRAYLVWLVIALLVFVVLRFFPTHRRRL